MTLPTIANSQTPSKVEFSWEQCLDGDLPALLAQQRFSRAVHDVTATAKAALPELHERIDRARDLVLAGAVTPDADGAFTITSQSVRGKTYLVQGGCPCPAAEKDPRCKHVIATWLWRKAHQVLDTLGTPLEALLTTLPPTASPLPHPLPEAPASVNVEVQINGRLARLTLRDSDETRLLERLEALLQRFPDAAAAPTPPEAWCDLHSCSMQRHSNQKGTWYSHRLDTGTWCRGKA